MPPPSSGEGVATSAEERRKVADLVANVFCDADEALHALRECNGDVEAAANRLLEEGAWRRGTAARRAPPEAAERAALFARAAARCGAAADARGRADRYCEVKGKKTKKKEVRCDAPICGGGAADMRAPGS